MEKKASIIRPGLSSQTGRVKDTLEKQSLGILRNGCHRHRSS